jgi:mono/diheme cytochrome c family protein
VIRYCCALGVILFWCLPLLPAQQNAASQPALTNSQKDGRRVFQQKCAVCHVPPSPVSDSYAPQLSKGMVQGNEDFIRMMILDGREDRMPGFKYILTTKQVESIIDYLKTLSNPPHTVGAERPE